MADLPMDDTGTITSIEYTYCDGGFLADETGVDVEASMNRFEALLEEELRSAYRDATVEVHRVARRGGPTTIRAWEWVESQDPGTDQWHFGDFSSEKTEGDVRAIADRVYEGRMAEWIVEQAHA